MSVLENGDSSVPVMSASSPWPTPMPFTGPVLGAAGGGGIIDTSSASFGFGVAGWEFAGVLPRERSC